MSQEVINDTLPEMIRTSMLINETKKDFQVIIQFPSIEYSIIAKNFTFLKTLTRSEVREYLDQGFQ
jgi:hypothetical protein